MAEIKPSTSIDEQIRILEERQLEVPSKQYAHKILNQIGYYRLSGYTLTLRKGDVFYPGISFNNIVDIYKFDAQLKSNLLYILGFIEIKIRIQVANTHAQTHGPLGYSEGLGFTNIYYFNEFIEKVKRATFIDPAKDRESYEAFVRHHHEKYGGKFPIWVAMELLSFSTTSKAFSNMDESLKIQIADSSFHVGYKYLQNWLRGLSELRNICAHYGRLYNRPMTYKPRLSSQDSRTVDLKSNRFVLFSLLLIIKKLVQDEHIWQEFSNNLIQNIEDHPFVSLRFYGFPSNWAEILKS